MRRLIVSDLHANIDALEAVLLQAKDKYDEIACCGDLVGYGGSPCEVLDWTREHVAQTVRGNHDKACCGLDDLEWFNDVARKAALWTETALGPDRCAYLANLPRGPIEFPGYVLAHGSPLDEDEYLVNDFDVAGLESELRRPLTFIGHTHLQGGWMWDPHGHRKVFGPEAGFSNNVLSLREDAVYLLNPGSVGQPRDHDPRAAYLIWDEEAQQVTFYRVPYDIGKAQEKILHAGLPGLLAQRLAVGR